MKTYPFIFSCAFRESIFNRFRAINLRILCDLLYCHTLGYPPDKPEGSGGGGGGGGVVAGTRESARAVSLAD